MGRSDDRRDRRRSRSRSPTSRRKGGGSSRRSQSPYNDRGHRKRSKSPKSHRDGRGSRGYEESDRMYHHRDRDFDRRDKDRRRRSRSREAKTMEEIVGHEVSLGDLDIDAEQRKLDILMQQRRERVEKWRSEQASKRGESGPRSGKSVDERAEDVILNRSGNEECESVGGRKKGWTLDDEDEEEDQAQDMDIEEEEEDGRELLLPKKETEEEKEREEEEEKLAKKLKKGKKSEEMDQVKKEEEDPQVDPLETFMKGINAEVKSLRGKTVKEESVGSKAKIVVTIAPKSVRSEEEDSNDGTSRMAPKRKPSLKQLKGEVLEQDQDAMEYSSEDEATTTEDLQSMSSALSNQSKLKQVRSVRLEDVTFRPFQKRFYIEVPELSQMSSEEVDAYREVLEGIKVRGKNCPKPIKSWAQAGLSRRVMEVLHKHNYIKPTPIQAQGIPAIMSGRDVIGIAKTGSGKTLAFLLPLFRHLMAQEELESGDGPIGLVMAPTRELAKQIRDEAKKFTDKLGLRVVVIYGGSPISEQIGQLKYGAEIVVCTPGRMIDMLAANNGRVTNLRRTTYVVLDEADRMFDMGFEPQVIRILDCVRPDRQMVMFSATFPR